jgi:outer membrane protein assembly factor BamB
MRTSITFIIVIVIMICGCSSQQNTVLNPLSDLEYLSNAVDTQASSIGILGAFSMDIDLSRMEAELTPLRSSSIGEAYIVSGEAYFTISPCTNCLRIKNIALDVDGNIVLGMMIKHPFPKGDTLKPPSAANRLDLDIFDVALLVKPIDTAAQSYPLTGVESYPNILMNADGATNELSSLGDDSVLPYKIVYESENNNRFEMGFDYQPFEILLNPGSLTTFDLYLTFGYGASAKKPQRLSPTYYVPEFNRKVAWKVVVTPPEGANPPAMGNTWDSLDTSTQYTVNIDIYDWNHGATIASEFPDSNNTNYISASSDVTNVTIEVPGMTGAIVTALRLDTTTNGWDDPLTYSASFANQNALVAGEYFGIVKVSDSRAPGDNSVNGQTDTLVYSPDGIRIEWYSMTEFAAYQIFKATVVEGFICEPPIPASINPASFITNPGIYNDVAITGDHFDEAGGVTQVYLDNDINQIYATDINVGSNTQLTCDFDVSGADLGIYDVVVFTACEGRGEDLLEITSWPQEWSCFQYNSYNLGMNPNPQAFNYLSFSQKWYMADSGYKYSGPAISQTHVYVATNNSFYSSSAYHRLTCFDINDGHIVWQKYINPTGDYARAHTSPVWFDDGSDGRVVIGGDRIWCFDALTGNEEWQYGSSYMFIGASPKVYQGKVVCAGSGAYSCVDAMTGVEIWRSVAGTSGSESTPAVYEGKLYSGAGTNYACLDMTDGSIIWQKTGYPGTSHWDAPFIAGDRLYYSSYNQLIMCLDRNTGDIIWQYTETTSSPWISAMASHIDPSDDKLVIFFSGAYTNGGLWAIKDQGTYAQKLWKSVDFYCDSSPVYNDGIVWVGDVYNSRLYGYNWQTGARVVDRSLNDYVRSAVGFAFDKMVATTTSGVYCFE